MKRDDSLWKAILEDVFDDFLKFFIPEAEAIFDFNRPFEFLDKELEQLFPNDPDDFSPRYVDKLVKVFTLEGNEEWILVHVEVQGIKDADFERRMFQYFYRIYDKFQRPITAFAILTDTNKNFKPEYFERNFCGTSVKYVFNRFKVLEQDEIALAESMNPFAMIVLTTLLALRKGKVSEEELLNEKITLLRKLLNKGFNRNKIEALIGFLKLYVRFSDKSRNDFKFDEALSQELKKPKETMGIVEFVLERERRKGMEDKSLQFAQKLIDESDFNDAKIAALTGVEIAVVQELRKDKN